MKLNRAAGAVMCYGDKLSVSLKDVIKEKSYMSIHITSSKLHHRNELQITGPCRLGNSNSVIPDTCTYVAQ
jgi:hypothetical protein